MGVWVYESHLGGLYTYDNPLPVEDLYCEECGDSDWDLGEFETLRDFLRYYADNICVDECEGGYPLDVVLDDIAHRFDDNLTWDEAACIVWEARKELEEECEL
mgnify:CR=1 FL=1